MSRPRTRVLFLASNPLRDAPVAVDVEARQILDRIRADERLELVFVPAPRVTDLLRAAERQRPVIVHVTGHGNTKELFFLAEDDAPTSVPVPALTALMRTMARDEARLVVLNYCESFAAARAITDDPEGNIAFAVGTRSAIPDTDAIAFATAFYGAIAAGRSVARAFEEGKVQVQLTGGDAERICLLVRAGVDASRFVLTAALEPETACMAPAPEPPGMAEPPCGSEPAGMAAPPPTLERNLLRAPPADFTGRSREMAEVMQKLGEAGVLVSGQGGIGKTALALELATQLAGSYPDAQIDIELRGSSASPLADEAAMVEVINAFDPGVKIPSDAASLAGLYRATLHGKRALLVLDDARDAEQIARLMPPPGNFVLATGWTYFVAPGVEPYDLGEMSPADASALVRRIAARLTEAEAGQLAKLCGYVPLALRAAAGTLAQRRDLKPARYLERLRSAGERVKLIDAVLREGAALLEPRAREAWELLGVFVGDFDASGVAAVLGVDGDLASDILGQILQQNLIEWDEQTERYRLHDLVRDYVRLRVDPTAVQAVGTRFAEHFTALAVRAGERIAAGGSEMLEGLATFDRDRRNIAVAVAWTMERAEADGRIAALLARLLGGCAYGLALREQARDRVAWFGAAALAAKRGDEPATAALLLGNKGVALLELDEVVSAIAAHEEELSIAREVGDPRLIASALGNLGVAQWVMNEVDAALSCFDEQLSIARRVGDRRIEANALGNLGNAAWSRKDVPKAAALYEERLAIARATFDKRAEGTALGNLASTRALLGKPDEALPLYEQRLAIALEIGDRRGEGAALGNMGVLLLERGEVAKAIEQLERHLAIAEQLGDIRAERHAVGQLCTAYYKAGDAEKNTSFAAREILLRDRFGDDPSWNLGDGELPPPLLMAQVEYGGMQGGPAATETWVHP